MKTNRTQSRIGVVVVALFVLFGIGAASRATVQAQDRDQNRRGRNWDNYGNYGGSFQLRQTALNAGYNEGTQDGRNDRQKRRTTDFRNNNTYRKATKDYSSKLGDREIYRRYFREAYENGYNADLNTQNNRNSDLNRNNNGNDQNSRGRNWDRYDNYGGSFDLRQTALNAGYNEGIKEGRKDRNNSRPSDYRSNGAYQDATTDYSSKLGDRDLYRRYYRAGYENGYRDGRVNGL